MLGLKNNQNVWVFISYSDAIDANANRDNNNYVFIKIANPFVRRPAITAMPPSTACGFKYVRVMPKKKITIFAELRTINCVGRPVINTSENVYPYSWYGGDIIITI